MEDKVDDFAEDDADGLNEEGETVDFTDEYDAAGDLVDERLDEDFVDEELGTTYPGVEDFWGEDVEEPFTDDEDTLLEKELGVAYPGAEDALVEEDGFAEEDEDDGLLDELEEVGFTEEEEGSVVTGLLEEGLGVAYPGIEEAFNDEEGVEGFTEELLGEGVGVTYP